MRERNNQQKKRKNWLWGINLMIIIYGVAVIYNLVQCTVRECMQDTLLFPSSLYVFVSKDFLTNNIPIFANLVSSSYWFLYSLAIIINFSIICLTGALLGIIYSYRTKK